MLKNLNMKHKLKQKLKLTDAPQELQDAHHERKEQAHQEQKEQKEEAHVLTGQQEHAKNNIIIFIKKNKIFLGGESLEKYY